MNKWRVVKGFVFGEAILGHAGKTTRNTGVESDVFTMVPGETFFESEKSNKFLIKDNEYSFDGGTAFKKFCTLEEIIDESVTGDTAPGDSAEDHFMWVQPTELDELVPGRVYRTPDAFYEDSLMVAVRGLMVARENEDGFEIIDDRTFMMKEELAEPNDWVMAGYVKK